MPTITFSHTTENSDILSSGTYTNQSGRFSRPQVVATVYDSLLLSERTVVGNVYWLKSLYSGFLEQRLTGFKD